MTQIIQKVKFRKINCQFQNDLKNDITSVKSDNRLFVKADKSTNFYKLDAAKYNQLLNDNITKAYKKSDGSQLKTIDTEAKAITKMLKIDDRVEITAQKEAFITLKAHKDVTLDLTTERFKPYLKPATTPIYVHSRSNHPPNIIRHSLKQSIKGYQKFPLTKMHSTKLHPYIRKLCARAGMHTTSSSTRLRKDHQTKIEGGGI